MRTSVPMGNGPVVWMCVHNEPADSCDKCEDEDFAVNGEFEIHEEQCQHEFVDADGVCWDCHEYVDGR